MHGNRFDATTGRSGVADGEFVKTPVGGDQERTHFTSLSEMSRSRQNGVARTVAEIAPAARAWLSTPQKSCQYSEREIVGFSSVLPRERRQIGIFGHG